MENQGMDEKTKSLMSLKERLLSLHCSKLH